jgi:hypothetical protein
MYPTRPTAINYFVRISACHKRYWRQISYRRSFDDRNGFDDLLLVQLRTWTVQVTNDGGHAGLVAHGGGEVDLGLRVILGEAVNLSMVFFYRRGKEFVKQLIVPLDLSSVTGSTLARQECQRAVARRFVLSVRHGDVR